MRSPRIVTKADHTASTDPSDDLSPEFVGRARRDLEPVAVAPQGLCGDEVDAVLFKVRC